MNLTKRDIFSVVAKLAGIFVAMDAFGILLIPPHLFKEFPTQYINRTLFFFLIGVAAIGQAILAYSLLRFSDLLADKLLDNQPLPSIFELNCSNSIVLFSLSLRIIGLVNFTGAFTHLALYLPLLAISKELFKRGFFIAPGLEFNNVKFFTSIIFLIVGIYLMTGIQPLAAFLFKERR